MTITANKSPIILLLLIAGILFSSCRTSEEIVEPEPEPEAPSEQLERETFEEPEPESDTSGRDRIWFFLPIKRENSQHKKSSQKEECDPERYTEWS